MKYKAILALMLVVPMALLVAASKNSASVTFA